MKGFKALIFFLSAAEKPETIQVCFSISLGIVEGGSNPSQREDRRKSQLGIINSQEFEFLCSTSWRSSGNSLHPHLPHQGRGGAAFPGIPLFLSRAFKEVGSLTLCWDGFNVPSSSAGVGQTQLPLPGSAFLPFPSPSIGW